MEDFDDDLKSEKQTRRPRSASKGCSGGLWNLLTVLALLVVAAVVVVFSLIYLNPYTGINPFPPPTLPPRLTFPTNTPTPLVPPTSTEAPTLEPTVTFTPRPTGTLPPTPTFFSIITPTETPTITPPAAGYAFEVRKGSPSAISNIYHPELACNWMGVGGQVVDMSNQPVIGLIVRLGGFLPGVQLQQPMMSLTGVALSYGRAGYEFALSDKPVASKQSLWVQLLDQSGIPQSDKVYFDTFASCDKNLIVIDFKQVR
ncbi:MAG: hypothetical protein JXB15_06815 [Anaerolineales bacterium]|nr:hypothetical protein [Anaerolineales bacterium]